MLPSGGKKEYFQMQEVLSLCVRIKNQSNILMSVYVFKHYLSVSISASCLLLTSDIRFVTCIKKELLNMQLMLMNRDNRENQGGKDGKNHDRDLTIAKFMAKSRHQQFSQNMG